VKGAIALISLGVLLIADGLLRMAEGILGIINDSLESLSVLVAFIVGGMLTGLLLGGYVMYRGIRRYRRMKSRLNAIGGAK